VLVDAAGICWPGAAQVGRLEFNLLRGAGHDRIALATRYFAAKVREVLARLGKASTFFPFPPVGAMQMILLVSDQELRGIVESSTLGEYVKSLRAGVRDAVGRLPETSAGADLVVEVKLAPDADPAFAYGLRSIGTDSTLGEHLPERLERVPAPYVEGELRFQILFPLWGGTGRPLVGGEGAVDRPKRLARPPPHMLVGRPFGTGHECVPVFSSYCW
jgi:hypothetical protein